MTREIQTERLRLRQWVVADREPFAAMNANPQVMEFFPSLLSRSESDAFSERIESHIEKTGFGLWAAEIPKVTPFAGFIGLAIPRFEAHFTPCIEIGWRLSPDYWTHGYTTEGARAVLMFAFNELKLDEIISFTAPKNLSSRRVMEKIGMTRNAADDFDYPTISATNPLRRQVLYRINRSDWQS